MPDGLSPTDRRPELLQVIHKVRSRWRLRLALRGTVIVVAGTLLALLLSASSLEALRFSPPPSSRSASSRLLVFAALAYLGLVRPLVRQVERQPGGDVSGGMRSVAAGRHHERRRNLGPDDRRRIGPVAQAGRAARRAGHRSVPRARRRPRRRTSADLKRQRLHARRRRGRPRCCSCRSGRRSSATACPRS